MSKRVIKFSHQVLPLAIKALFAECFSEFHVKWRPHNPVKV